MSMQTIAVVDDEENLRESVSFALRREGYAVDEYDNGLTAWQRFQKQQPSLVVLDILMPQMDGLELCRKLRAMSETLPIIFLTSRDDEFDRILGLELGADDYLCKPFSMRELTTRIKVLLRRAALLGKSVQPARGEEPLRVGPLELDLQRYQVRWKEQPVDLTVTEFMMLHALVKHPGHVKTRQQLTRDGYPHDTYVSDRTIDSHIKNLRRKLGAVPEGGDPIESVYGVGYKLAL